MAVTDLELRALIDNLESARVERTVSTTDKEKFGQAICAFANDLPNHKLPGYLLIGVDDKTGRVDGVQATDQLLTMLANLRAQGNLTPAPTMAVERRVLDGVELVVVEVQPSDLCPVRYQGRIWTRIGPSKAIASEDDERILIEKRGATLGRTFDTQPCIGSTIKDLSMTQIATEYIPLAIAPEVLEANHRSEEHKLASLKLYDLTRQCPTNAAMLLFGLNPQFYIEGARVQFLRIDGDSLSDPITNDKSLSGALASMMVELEAIIDANNPSRSVSASTLREQSSSDYPKVALRELLVNAVIHRNYQGSTAPIRFTWFNDRIEIQSPGGLYGEANISNFPRQNAYRNPILAEVFLRLGYANRFGHGVIRAQSALKTNGNPEAKFEIDSNFVLVTISKAS